ncbi:tyrosine-type recombinase/integrase, partial [Sphingobium sp.]|uniref:tyrosine-type recombinase/integrase n=1 Tax=Sphingobium sp. TaxID=1912891 RepID=UPI003BB7AC81
KTNIPISPPENPAGCLNHRNEGSLLDADHPANGVLFARRSTVTVSLPILPPLAISILATPSHAMIFILNGFGRPFSEKGFGNRFRVWCDKAGLPNCTAHGLRKAAARRFAEAGCSNQQIKSWTGHTTDSEVARYTAAADQKTLSDEAGDMLMANLRKRLANRDDNLLEKEA